MTASSSPSVDLSPSAPAVIGHERALVETEHIGPGTRILAFAHVMPGARIGADCTIRDHTFVEGDVIVGDRVTIGSGVNLWDGVRLGDDVFVGANATFTNDRFPRSKRRFECRTTTIRSGSSVGEGAVILPGITVGEGAMIGAGAVVTKDVPEYAMVAGNPARVVRGLDQGAAPSPISHRDRTKD